MKKDEIEKRVDEGYIHVHVLFEVVGTPKNHVTDALKKYLSEIKQNPRILVVAEDMAEPVEKNKLWSTFCEAEFLVLGLDTLSWLCVNYTPASIEVLAPSELTYADKDLSMWINDLLARLHEIGVASKSLQQKNKMLERNISVIVRNCIIALVGQGKDAATIGKSLGLDEEQVVQFLNSLEAEGKIKKEGDLYQKI